jgi:hypothetical protein
MHEGLENVLGERKNKDFRATTLCTDICGPTLEGQARVQGQEHGKNVRNEDEKRIETSATVELLSHGRTQESAEGGESASLGPIDELGGDDLTTSDECCEVVNGTKGSEHRLRRACVREKEMSKNRGETTNR